MKNWFITFHSESGDHYVLGTFSCEQEPTKLELDALARRDLSHEIDDNLLLGRFEVNECGPSNPMPSADLTVEPLERI